MTEAGKKTNLEVLEEFKFPQVTCIYHHAQFIEIFMKPLIDLGSKINAM